ncbi:MAG: GntP family permease, partial [Peptostreptococcaceae bacterium]|nr:GntP family permease [Peptostreptococcaceae bacterium]
MRPSTTLSLSILLLPILLILIGSVMNMFLPKGTGVSRFFGFIGDKNIALL